jgi:predicted LPLAT superfamily acyltransferase
LSSKIEKKPPNETTDGLDWMQQRERGNPFVLRLILWVALHGGRTFAGLFLYPITAYFLLAATEQRRASRRYLNRVLGSRPGWHHIFHHIFTFAATILDRVYLLTDRFDCFDIRIHNADALLRYVGQKKGCILLGSHLGSFEALRALALQAEKFDLKILMYPEHNQDLTSLLLSLDPKLERTVLSIGDPMSLVRAHEFLDQGSMVGMLGDRIDSAGKAVTCRFMGKPVNFPAGPIQFAALARAPVILFYGLYRGGRRYDIHFERFAEQIELPRQERESAIQGWVQRYADRLEHHTIQAPYNWFNFYDFWNEN